MKMPMDLSAGRLVVVEPTYLDCIGWVLVSGNVVCWDVTTDVKP